MIITPLTSDDVEEVVSTLPTRERQSAVRYQVSRPGQNYAMRLYGKLLGCGGMTIQVNPETNEVIPGVGEAWLVWIPTGKRYPKSVYRALRTLLTEMIEHMDLTEVQCFVAHEHVQGHRLTKHLGFALAQEHVAGFDYDLYRGIPQKEAANGR